MAEKLFPGANLAKINVRTCHEWLWKFLNKINNNQSKWHRRWQPLTWLR